MGAMKGEAIREAEAGSTENAEAVREMSERVTTLEGEVARLREVIEFHGLPESLPSDADRAWAAAG